MMKHNNCVNVNVAPMMNKCGSVYVAPMRGTNGPQC